MSDEHRWETIEAALRRMARIHCGGEDHYRCVLSRSPCAEPGCRRDARALMYWAKLHEEVARLAAHLGGRALIAKLPDRADGPYLIEGAGAPEPISHLDALIRLQCLRERQRVELCARQGSKPRPAATRRL